MEHYPVILILPDQAQTQGVFSFNDEANNCTLTLQFDGRTTSATADDYFEAMCQLRQLLEVEGIRLHCYGASRNVYPSRMARDMGRGLKAYKMTMGQPAKQTDLVSIFASDADVQTATVEEQRAYFRTWLKSLG
jgi:hypothetical protein